MEKVRPFLLITLVFLGLLIWQAWQDDYNKVGNVYENVQDKPATELNLETNASDLIPKEMAPKSKSLETFQPKEIDSNFSNTVSNSPISVETDVFNINFSEKGASIATIKLLNYPIDIKDKNSPLPFLGIFGDTVFLHQGGLFGKDGLPTHHNDYKLVTPRDKLKLKEGAPSIKIQFLWDEAPNYKVLKTYTLKRGSYLISVDYEVTNNGENDFSVFLYEQLKRTNQSSYNGMIYTFTGPVLSTPENRFEKFDYDDLSDKPIDVTTKDSWIGNMQHYFVAALVPKAQSEVKFYSKILNSSTYTVGFVTEELRVPAMSQNSISTTIYAGPKKQDVLEKIAPGLDLTVDYGVLWFLAKPLFIVLNTIHSVVSNWGWSIIILTILIKLAFYPLSAAGYKSMAQLRKVQPRMLAIKERYSSDRTQLNQAMMKLYKEEKINPLGGCFPILIQIPVFIALYWVLLESVEIRQAPFILWINDLSSKDPYFVLPVLMGLSMWFQQKLNPAPVDPIQAKVMQLLPIIFTIFFAFFPSGLVLYWVANNILSIAQQWRITSQIEKNQKTK